MQKALSVNRLSICLTFMLSVLLVECSRAPRIDASSDTSLNASIDRVRAAVPADRIAKFEQDLNVIVYHGAYAAVFAGEPGNPRRSKEVKAALNGKTADEVIAFGEKILKQQIAKDHDAMQGGHPQN